MIEFVLYKNIFCFFVLMINQNKVFENNPILIQYDFLIAFRQILVEADCIQLPEHYPFANH
ncbi:hypothetical protein SALWKB2_1115 [Snodgrassella alvi wkB2]|nr:hypothetical protein SALWKB2_1115 [Snodgrassella alvi wkB2]